MIIKINTFNITFLFEPDGRLLGLIVLSLDHISNIFGIFI